MNWDLSVPWTRTTRTQTQIQEHKPRNYLKKKKLTKARNSPGQENQPTATNPLITLISSPNKTVTLVRDQRDTTNSTKQTNK